MLLNNVLDLFFPKVCYTCYDQLLDFEHYVCTRCRHRLPITNFHFTNSDTIKKTLYGRVQLEQATALLYFEKKGIVQQLIHNLKYRGHEDIGVFLGQWLGGELKRCNAYKDIDVVIPVPIHKQKLKQRGYNQVAKFAIEISKALNVEYFDNCLVKISHTESQVRKKRFARWQIHNEQFSIKNSTLIEGKHILLVDDIITTGATLESCISILKTVQNVKISIATMAIA